MCAAAASAHGSQRKPGLHSRYGGGVRGPGCKECDGGESGRRGGARRRVVSIDPTHDVRCRGPVDRLSHTTPVLPAQSVFLGGALAPNVGRRWPGCSRRSAAVRGLRVARRTAAAAAQRPPQSVQTCAQRRVSTVGDSAFHAHPTHRESGQRHRRPTPSPPPSSQHPQHHPTFNSTSCATISRSVEACTCACGPLFPLLHHVCCQRGEAEACGGQL